MKSQLLIPLLLIPLLLTVVTLTGQQVEQVERVWTDDQGRKVKATFVKVEEDSAILRMTDGRELPYPLEKLSKSDQALIKKNSIAKKKKAAADARAAKHGPLNFDSPWPKRVTFNGDPGAVVISEDPQKKAFVYESINFRYTSDVSLPVATVKEFAVFFEASYKLSRELPIALGDGNRTKGKFMISIIAPQDASTENYKYSVYDPPGKVLASPASLGLSASEDGYQFDDDNRDSRILHPIFHHFTPNRYWAPGSKSWFTEGICEYATALPYEDGSFDLKSVSEHMTKFATAYGKDGKRGYNLGNEIYIGPLKDFMLLPEDKIYVKSDHNLGYSLLLVNYFLHMDRKGDAARMKKFLKGLRARKRGDAALEVLLDGQTWAELERDIIKAYSRENIELTFTP